MIKSFVQDMTPIQYSASLRQLPFAAACRMPRTMPQWRVCNGLVCVTAPGKREIVTNRLLFGIQQTDDGEYEICQYWTEPQWDGVERCYTLRTLKEYGHRGKLMPIAGGLTYDDMVEQVRAAHPSVIVPSRRQFLRQFGLYIQKPRNDDD